MASISELAEVIRPRLEMTSQHDTVRLTDEVRQRELLDARGGDAIEQAKANYAAAWVSAARAKADLRKLEAEQNASEARVDEARFMLEQAAGLNPTQQEYDDIMAALKTAEHAETLARAASAASEALNGEGGALDALGVAARALEEAGALDESLEARANTLREAIYTTEDISRELAGYIEAIDFDASELAEMQELASRYQMLTRKWGPTIEALASRLSEAQDLINNVEGGSAVLDRAREAADAAEQKLVQRAACLSEARAAVAPEFARDVSTVMARLCMGSASLECNVRELPRSQWSEEGADAIEFMYRPAAEMSARPLAKIASGGELSRVLLAIYVSSPIPSATYIFDEIDAGVGGETARALADVLAQLAKTRQVIVITHLAQVAAVADTQLVVEKIEEAGVARTQVCEVAGEARVREVARMLSGKATDASLAHARELLDSK
jgi:DNA repair protein RecN (Recombination protein N)